jgi:EpsD family peptidyl-prolyl cis-trans isomerase
MTVVVLAVGLALTGCGKKGHGASQTAAKVNKEEITVHQINYVLQQQRGLRPEQTDQASRQILERLIDQELAVQKAEDLKLDRDPRVAQQLEAAKREILARAYLERVSDGAPKPSADEARKYYEDNPALFKERRVYDLHEITLQAKPEQIPAVREKLNASKTVAEFTDYLKSQNIRFNDQQATRAAEQLPLNAVNAFAKMKEGDSVINPTPIGAQVLFVSGARSEPVDFELAKPRIEAFLANERKRKFVAEDLKNLRSAAKIEYVGKYAEPAASAASGGGDAIPAALPASEPASGG